ncbi:MAG TPA: metallophosphoesterase [Xanthobacteraceae bacterium]
MKLWIMSDIHTELTEGWDLPGPGARPDFDVLVVAGDLVPRMERGVAWLRERLTNRPIIYVPGNHEFYGTDLDKTVDKARVAADGTNVHILQNDAIRLCGVRFIGATLWTDFNLFGNPAVAMDAALLAMTDFQRIWKSNYQQRLRPIDTVARHMESRAFVVAELAKPSPEKRVVVTHHAPLGGARRPGYEEDAIAAAYTSSLEYLIANSAPDLWIYGHVHISDDRTIGAARIVSNAKGYGPYPPMGLPTWDNPDFDPHFVIDV